MTDDQRKTPDRETVILGLAEVSEYTRTKADIAGVGKGKEVFNSMFRAAEDAIALLKEQEPVVPETIVQTGIGEEPMIRALICGNCHKIMSYCVEYNFCPWCGKAVKWND